MRKCSLPHASSGPARPMSRRRCPIYGTRRPEVRHMWYHFPVLHDIVGVRAGIMRAGIFPGGHMGRPAVRRIEPQRTRRRNRDAAVMVGIGAVVLFALIGLVS